jgi:hypothetical protein
MPQRRSLSLVMVEGQLVVVEEQQALVGLPMTAGAVMSRSGQEEALERVGRVIPPDACPETL